MPPLEKEKKLSPKEKLMKQEQLRDLALTKDLPLQYIVGAENADRQVLLRSSLARSIGTAARRSIKVKKIDAASQMKMEKRYRNRGY